MIIDFRLRPPFKSFTTMANLFGPDGGTHAYPFCGAGTPAPSADNKDMDLFFKEMDAAGITKGCIYGRQSSGASMRGSVKNEDVKELCNKYPDKFIGFGMVNTDNNIEDSIKTVEKCKNEYKFRGMVCEPANSDKNPMFADDKKLFPIYEACIEAGMVICVHLAPFVGPDISYANAIPVQIAAKAFPKGRFVIIHGGYPYILQAIMATIVTPNLWIMPDLFWEYPVPMHDVYTQGCMLARGNRFLFASSYPFISMGQAVDAMKALNLPEPVYNRLMYENAQEILGL